MLNRAPSVILAALAALALSACSGTSDPANGGTTGAGGATATVVAGTLGVVSVADLHAELPQKDFRFLNVHTPHDADIPGTDAAIAYSDLDAIVAFVGSELTTKVVVYCSGDSMSKEAGQGLAARGYREVRYLDGGMTGWTKAGYSLTK